jgi:hypothetical protein
MVLGSDHLFEMDDRRCIDCQTPITFLGVPSEATCQSCGLKMYLVDDGIGRYPRGGWTPGGIQGRRPGQELGGTWHPAQGPQDLAEEAGRQLGMRA